MKDASGIPRNVRTAIAAIAAISPDLAARIAMFAVTRTKRRALRPAEKALLARGEPLEIVHGRQTIRAWTWGAGPTVHLVHGWNGRSTQLGAFVAPLVASGMRVIAHDSVGHGASTGSSSSVVEMADTLRRVVEATGPARAIIAHSMGALATSIALDRGLVTARATFIAAPADTSMWPEQIFGLAGIAAERARLLAEERLRTTYARLTATSLGRSIRIPVLVAHDRNDETVPFEDALANVRSIRDAGLLATTGYSHTSILRAPDVIEEVARFTASDVEQRRAPSTLQRRLDRELFVPDVRWAHETPIAQWG